MKRLPPFTIVQPESAAEASELLAEQSGEASLYAGGTELLLAMKEGVLRYEMLIDVKTIPGLSDVRLTDDTLLIGAAVTHESIERSPIVRETLPALATVERRVANPRVRSTGTLMGNLCFAEPHSDPATLLLCLNAKLIVESREGQRTIGLDDLLVDAYETSLAEDEVATQIVVPLPASPTRIGYEKFLIHERPTLGLAVVLETDEAGESIVSARTAIGCVSPTPRRSEAAERGLEGAIAELEDRLDDVAEALATDAELIDDADGSTSYKRQLIRVFLGRAIRSAFGPHFPAPRSHRNGSGGR